MAGTTMVAVPSRCPLCNHGEQAPFDGQITRCIGCSELLHPDELVRRATRRTRRRYNRNNNHHRSYR